MGIGQKGIFEINGKWIIFPWTSTRALQYWLQLCGLKAEFPMMMFPWVVAIEKLNPDESKGQFINRLQEVETSGFSVEDVVQSMPIGSLRIHKFEEFLPGDLIKKRAGQEWLD